jgi:hypothetical protein
MDFSKVLNHLQNKKEYSMSEVNEIEKYLSSEEGKEELSLSNMIISAIDKKNNHLCKCEIENYIPSYYDNLLNEEQRNLVEEHLINCLACQEIYADMFEIDALDFKLGILEFESSNFEIKNMLPRDKGNCLIRLHNLKKENPLSNFGLYRFLYDNANFCTCDKSLSSFIENKTYLNIFEFYVENYFKDFKITEWEDLKTIEIKNYVFKLQNKEKICTNNYSLTSYDNLIIGKERLFFKLSLFPSKREKLKTCNFEETNKLENVNSNIYNWIKDLEFIIEHFYKDSITEFKRLYKELNGINPELYVKGFAHPKEVIELKNVSSDFLEKYSPEDLDLNLESISSKVTSKEDSIQINAMNLANLRAKGIKDLLAKHNIQAKTLESSLLDVNQLGNKMDDLYGIYLALDREGPERVNSYLSV